jgi:hypothetical protein
LKHQKQEHLKTIQQIINKTFFNRFKNNPMKLNEIKNIGAIKAEALSNIKGGGRDTRNDPQQPVSPIIIIIPNPK